MPPRKKGAPRTRPARGTTMAPENPTGRYVITSTTPEAGKNGGSQVTHWLPAEGTVWACPESHCGRTFTRDEDRRGVPWRLTGTGPNA